MNEDCGPLYRERFCLKGQDCGFMRMSLYSEENNMRHKPEGWEGGPDRKGPGGRGEEGGVKARGRLPQRERGVRVCAMGRRHAGGAKRNEWGR